MHSYSPSPLGKSDNNLIVLTPQDVSVVQKQPDHHKDFEEVDLRGQRPPAPQICFETTIWNALCKSHGDDMNHTTDCITDYINFCEDTTIPTRMVVDKP